MTVGDLKRVLAALPRECDALPVKLHACADELHCNRVLITPANNAYGATPKVLLTSTDDLPPGECCDVLTLLCQI